MPKSKRKSRRSKSKSGFFGVTKSSRSHKYGAYIKIDGKLKCIGSSYETAKQAAKAFDVVAIKFRRTLNFPIGESEESENSEEIDSEEENDSEEDDDKDESDDSEEDDDEDNDQYDDALEAVKLMFTPSTNEAHDPNYDSNKFMDIREVDRSLILKRWASKSSSNWLREFEHLFHPQLMPWSIHDDIQVLNIRHDSNKQRSQQTIMRLLPKRTEQSVNMRFAYLQTLFGGSVDIIDKYKTETKSLRRILRKYDEVAAAEAVEVAKRKRHATASKKSYWKKQREKAAAAAANSLYL